MSTRVQFASKLLSSALAAGLIGSIRDPRPLIVPRVDDLSLAYPIYLLRKVQIEGTLLANPYLARSRGMVSKFKPRKGSLNAARKLLLQREEIRVEDLEKDVQGQVATAWTTGRIYFRGRSLTPGDLGSGFASTLEAAGTRLLPEPALRRHRSTAQRADAAPGGGADRSLDAVANQFPGQAQRLRGVLGQLNRLPGAKATPPPLERLQDALEQCTRQVRQTRPTVQQVKRHLDALNDGIELVNIFEAELTDAAASQVIAAANVRDHQAAQLREIGALDTDLQAACARLADSLAGERPWRDIAVLDPDLAKIRDAYTGERERRLASARPRKSRYHSTSASCTITIGLRAALLQKPVACTATGFLKRWMVKPERLTLAHAGGRQVPPGRP